MIVILIITILIILLKSSASNGEQERAKRDPEHRKLLLYTLTNQKLLKRKLHIYPEPPGGPRRDIEASAGTRTSSRWFPQGRERRRSWSLEDQKESKLQEKTNQLRVWGGEFRANDARGFHCSAPCMGCERRASLRRRRLCRCSKSLVFHAFVFTTLQLLKPAFKTPNCPDRPRTSGTFCGADGGEEQRWEIATDRGPPD